MLVPNGRQATFSANQVGVAVVGGAMGGASSRFVAYLNLTFVSKAKNVWSAPFANVVAHISKNSPFLGELLSPAYIGQKGQVVDLFRDDRPSPKGPIVPAELPSLSRGRFCCKEQAFSPVSFLLLERTVSGPEWSCPFRNGRSPGETGDVQARGS